MISVASSRTCVRMEASGTAYDGLRGMGTIVGGDGGGAAAHLANGHDLLDLFFDGIVVLLLRGLFFPIKGLSGSKPLAKNIIDEVVACEHGRSNAVSSTPVPCLGLGPLLR